MLRRWRPQQNEERLLVGPGYVDGGYVFCRPDGAVYSPDRFRRKSSASRSSSTGPAPANRCRG
jgi:hypothetical protein